MNEQEFVFTHLLGCERSRLYLDGQRAVGPAIGGRAAEVLRRRIAGEPVDYALGQTEFMGLRFAVGPDVLIPRPETELLVEKAVGLAGREAACSILELGTGSGAVAVSLALMLPYAHITATDISIAAVLRARANAQSLGAGGRIDFVVCDLFEGLKGTYDLIVSNPPYVANGMIPRLDREVRHEPLRALDGGPDGLDYYRRIASAGRRFLFPSGNLCVETGYDQSGTVAALFEANGFIVTDIVKDYSGIDRVVAVKKS